MSTFRTNIRLKDAGSQDYERLDKEMARKAFTRVEDEQAPATALLYRGRDYQYRGSGSLPEVTAAAYRAAHNTGKQYSFTIIRQKAAYQS